jgi:clan AA aspartic protease
MITGHVNADHEAVIPVVLLSPDQQQDAVEAVLDTGFNGYLTLSSQIIHRLSLPLVGNRRAMLGDGHVVVLDMYLGWVLWHGRTQEVLILQADGGPLIGMALLYGSRVTLDVKEEGKVTIQELASEIES